jgi:hypothetical protein
MVLKCSHAILSILNIEEHGSFMIPALNIEGY